MSISFGPTLIHEMAGLHDAKLADVHLALDDIKTKQEESTARLENLNAGVVESLDDIKRQVDLATVKLIKLDEKIGQVLSLMQRDTVVSTVVACPPVQLPVITEIVQFPLELEEHALTVD